MHLELLSKSPFLSLQLQKQGLAVADPVAATATLLPAASHPDWDDPLALLRRSRNREWLRIALRALHGAPLQETLADLSNFADAAIQAALMAAQKSLQPRFGVPRDARGGESQLLVLGMGKLGGGELNFSSDIDLICAYTAVGETDGERSISNGEYFVKLVQEMVRLLASHSGDGFVFRVDLMLRPFGSASPVAIHVDAVEDYYQTHGREWERYALVKARPVAGDLAAGRALLKALQPFVFRRYLDFDAIASLRELQQKIAADAMSRGLPSDDLKVGAGGIRECEFIVQSFQLVRGGQDVRLRHRGWASTLQNLMQQGLIADGEGQKLAAAYELLRRVENAVQIWADAQTHALPEDALRREWLAAATGFDDWITLDTALRRHREMVAGCFHSLFAEAAGSRSAPLRDAVKAELRGNNDAAQCTQVLENAGFGGHATEVRSAIAQLRESPQLRAATEQTVAKLNDLLPLLLDDAQRVAERVNGPVADAAAAPAPAPALRDAVSRADADSAQTRPASPMASERPAPAPALRDAVSRADADRVSMRQTPRDASGRPAPAPALRDAVSRADADRVSMQQTPRDASGRPAPAPALRDAVSRAYASTAFSRALEVVTAVLGRSTYLTLLRDSPQARENLLALVAASPAITGELVRHPVLLDQLLDARRLYTPPTRAQFCEELFTQMAELDAGEIEQAMQLLRQELRETRLRIASADAVAGLPLVKVSDALTWLAEAALEAALAFCWRGMVQAHGNPVEANGEPARFALIGYGKLGALEMSYASDLDLVFLHTAEPAEADTQGGKRPLPQSAWMARLVQKLIGLLTTQTHLGRAYEVDLELRPNGNAGMAVSSLESYAEYQEHKAWTWEHQALSRARFVAGDAALGAAFTAVRLRILCLPRDPAKLAADISSMREKMRLHVSRPRAGLWHVKHGQGGLVDVEFLVSHGVLASAHQHPEVATYPDVWRQLEALQAAGVLTQAEFETLLKAQRSYRAALHQRNLQGLQVYVPDSEFREERAAVSAIWQQRLGG